MTDNELERHLKDIIVCLRIDAETTRTARDRLRLAVDAAVREGAEEMRERAAAVCERWAAPTENGIVFTAHAKYVHKTNAECAAAIRALPVVNS